jgi:hypothetical protein
MPDSNEKWQTDLTGYFTLGQNFYMQVGEYVYSVKRSQGCQIFIPKLLF